MVLIIVKNVKNIKRKSKIIISPDEINKSLSNKGWIYNKKKIKKSYQFESYMQSIDFINSIAKLAETQNHHPDIKIGWCKVDIEISSHQFGGVTTKCANLATSIDIT